MDVLTNDLVGRVPLARATVLAVTGDRVVVRQDGASGGAEHACEVLQTGVQPPRLAVGDVVLVWDDGAGGRVVMGRIGATRAPAPAPPPEPAADVPDELVLEARQQLTLRVGDGSITIRADGRILIKGRDLVSHAQRTNRIRGGSVAIN